MKSVLSVLLMVTGTFAHASASADVPGEVSLSSDNTINITNEAADTIYDLLNVNEIDLQDQIEPDLLKKAEGIECQRHMNGTGTECRIKVTKKGVSK